MLPARGKTRQKEQKKRAKEENVAADNKALGADERPGHNRQESPRAEEAVRADDL